MRIATVYQIYYSAVKADESRVWFWWSITEHMVDWFSRKCVDGTWLSYFRYNNQLPKLLIYWRDRETSMTSVRKEAGRKRRATIVSDGISSTIKNRIEGRRDANAEGWTRAEVHLRFLSYWHSGARHRGASSFLVSSAPRLPSRTKSLRRSLRYSLGKDLSLSIIFRFKVVLQSDVFSSRPIIRRMFSNVSFAFPVKVFSQSW